MHFCTFFFLTFLSFVFSLIYFPFFHSTFSGFLFAHRWRIKFSPITATTALVKIFSYICVKLFPFHPDYCACRSWWWCWFGPKLLLPGCSLHRCWCCCGRSAPLNVATFCLCAIFMRFAIKMNIHLNMKYVSKYVRCLGNGGFLLHDNHG